MEHFLTVLGTVLVLEGIPWFLSPAGTRKMLLEIFALSDSRLRLIGLSAMLLGLLTVFLGVS